MTNHVHLLATPHCECSISKMMQSLGRCYIQYINKKYNRSGTLWEVRYRSKIIQSEQCFLTLMRYIEMNPVRAKMVTLISEYPWSSFQHNGQGKNIKLITPHPLYLALGKSKATRLIAYLSLFEQQIALYTLQVIRDATNKPWALGDKNSKNTLNTKQIEGLVHLCAAEAENR